MSRSITVGCVTIHLEGLGEGDILNIKHAIDNELQIRSNPGPELNNDEMALVRKGDLLSAIKHYRGRDPNGIGLKQAMDIVTAWRDINAPRG